MLIILLYLKDKRKELRSLKDGRKLVCVEYFYISIGLGFVIVIFRRLFMIICEVGVFYRKGISLFEI